MQSALKLRLQPSNLFRQYAFEFLSPVIFLQGEAQGPQAPVLNRDAGLDRIVERNQVAAACPHLHECAVHRDARKPSGKPGLASEAVEVHEGVLETILNRIFGILTIPRDAEGYAANTPGMLPDKITKGGWMSHPSCGQKHSLLFA